MLDLLGTGLRFFIFGVLGLVMISWWFALVGGAIGGSGLPHRYSGRRDRLGPLGRAFYALIAVATFIYAVTFLWEHI